MNRGIDLCKLAESIDNLEKFKTKLIEKGVITKEILQSVTAYCKSEEEEKLSIVTELNQKRPEALQKFFDCLVETEETDAAKIIHPSYQALRQNLRNSPSGTGGPSGAQANVQRKVQQAIRYVNEDETSVYRMKSNPKGYALVIVNQKFAKPERHPYLHGAKMDTTMLASLFQGLGYKMTAFLNLTTSEMEAEAKNFAARKDFKSVDSCIVVISTHGEKEFLVGSDSELISRERIIEPLNNKNCPDLKRKPKLFFFQACRGDKVDDGVHDIAAGTKIPSFTDMWIFYSTIPEYVAYVNTTHGSRFIRAVTEEFSEHAWNTSLQQLSVKVNEKMVQLGNEKGRLMQMPEPATRYFTKEFYFNPGLYETTA